MADLERQVLRIGEYELRRFDDKSIWLQHKNGEGMQARESDMAEIIHGFFTENF